jgi:hypothetical protein
MIYDNDVLRTLTRLILETAVKNLVRDGYLIPCGLFYDDRGAAESVPFHFETVEEKRRLQAGFRALLVNKAARAAIIVQESWMMFTSEGSYDATRSLADQAGRREAIVVEGRSRLAQVCLIQLFTKGPGGMILGKTMDVAHPITYRSEWFGTMWQQGMGHEDEEHQG